MVFSVICILCHYGNFLDDVFWINEQRLSRMIVHPLPKTLLALVCPYFSMLCCLHPSNSLFHNVLESLFVGFAWEFAILISKALKKHVHRVKGSIIWCYHSQTLNFLGDYRDHKEHHKVWYPWVWLVSKNNVGKLAFYEGWWGKGWWWCYTCFSVGWQVVACTSCLYNEIVMKWKLIM